MHPHMDTWTGENPAACWATAYVGLRKRQRAHPAEVAAGRSCNQSRCRDQRGRSEISINTECHSLVFKRPIWQERHLALVRSSWWRVGGLASVRESSELQREHAEPLWRNKSRSLINLQWLSYFTESNEGFEWYAFSAEFSRKLT